MDYLIADHRIRAVGLRLCNSLQQLPGFSVFQVKADGEPVCFLKEADEVTMPQFEQIDYSNETDGIVSRFGRASEGYLFDMTPADDTPLQVWITPNNQTALFRGNHAPRLLRFACWIAFGALTAHLSTVAVHTSAILYRGRVVFFLGESGTGKSTHTRLWREHIAGATLLNDDSPILRIRDGEPWVYGSPWSGKTACYKQECHPLAACVRLSQAPHNLIRRLNVVQGYAALHPSCPPCFAYDDTIYDHISHVLSSVLSHVPVFHLECLPDAAAAQLSSHTIFGNG